MPAAPLPAELRAAIPGLTASLAHLLANLAALIARAFLRHPVHVVHINALWAYINRAARRFARVMDRLAAGTLRPSPSRPGRATRPRKPTGFPTTHGWLLTELRHEAAFFGNRLTDLLEQPEAAALLAASPQAVRLLRPLCHILGASPAPLRPPPRPPRAPKPPKAEPPRPSAARLDGPCPIPAAAGPPPARPPRPLCPRLLGRWPFNQLPNLRSA